jgi:hypothetical protein
MNPNLNSSRLDRVIKLLPDKYMDTKTKSGFSLRKVQRKTWLVISLLLILLVVSLIVCVLTLSPIQGTVYVKTETELRTATNNAAYGLPVVIVLDQGITLTEPLVISVNKHITLESKGDMFSKLISTSNGPTVIVENSGTLGLEGIIVTHARGVHGTGVTVASGGTLSMTDGEILGNKVNYSGGGVYNSGTFTMSGDSVIANNTAVMVAARACLMVHLACREARFQTTPLMMAAAYL